MDHSRLDSAAVLEMGILSRSMPEDKCPKDAVLARVDEDDLTTGSLRQGLEAGGLEASMYYGCWSIWKDGDGFSGQLLQYRRETDFFSGKTLEEALEKAEEWAYGCMG